MEAQDTTIFNNTFNEEGASRMVTDSFDLPNLIGIIS